MGKQYYTILKVKKLDMDYLLLAMVFLYQDMIIILNILMIHGLIIEKTLIIIFKNGVIQLTVYHYH